MCAYKSVERQKNEPVVGPDYYLEITAEKGRYRVFDGRITFLVYDLKKEDLEYLKRNGQLSSDFKGEVHVVSKAGREYNADLGAETFNSFVKSDFKKLSDPNQKTDPDVLRRISLVTPSKLTFKASRVEPVHSPADVFLDENFKEFKSTEYIRSKLPKNTKHCAVGSKEFDALYAYEIDKMNDAIVAYADGDPTKLQQFIAALISQLKGSVNGTEEVVDLFIKLMWIMQTSGQAVLSFAGTSAEYKNGKKWETRTLGDDGKDILQAAKTKEGRTWLVGILQEWEYAKLKERQEKGFDVGREQAQILDYVLGRYTYSNGAYKEYQTKYAKARLGGGEFEVFNPRDYKSVSERTGGLGEKALGPSSLASLMWIFEVEPVKERKPEEPPPVVKKQEVILRPTISEDQDVTYAQNKMTYVAHISVYPNEEKAKDGQDLSAFIQANNEPASLRAVTYLWLVAVQVGGEVYFLNRNWDGDKNSQVYAGKLGKDGKSIHPCSYDARGRLVVDEASVVAQFPDKFRTDGQNDIPQVLDPNGVRNLFYVSQTDLTNTVPTITTPRVRTGKAIPHIYVMKPVREIEQPKPVQGGE